MICSNIHVAVVVVIEWQIPVSVASKLLTSQDPIDLRLVEADSMGQYLYCRIDATAIRGHTELGADVICSHSCVISGENNIGEVPALLGHI